ncbi:hypothetical protein CCMA1212_008919 [Trichoderma ghanense]|uniref:Uncharacterized protein n=1 Tax=Trichoderma ghanense TaxID=65468 RepID=A0ABY2GU18_9HYPO
MELRGRKIIWVDPAQAFGITTILVRRLPYGSTNCSQSRGTWCDSAASMAQMEPQQWRQQQGCGLRYSWNRMSKMASCRPAPPIAQAVLPKPPPHLQSRAVSRRASPSPPLSRTSVHLQRRRAEADADLTRRPHLTSVAEPCTECTECDPVQTIRSRWLEPLEPAQSTENPPGRSLPASNPTLASTRLFLFLFLLPLLFLSLSLDLSLLDSASATVTVPVPAARLACVLSAAETLRVLQSSRTERCREPPAVYACWPSAVGPGLGGSRRTTADRRSRRLRANTDGDRCLPRRRQPAPLTTEQRVDSEPSRTTNPNRTNLQLCR